MSSLYAKLVPPGVIWNNHKTAVQLWKTFYLADIIHLQIKKVFFSQFILSPSFLTVTQNIFAHLRIYFASFILAFSFSLECNNQALVSQRRLGQYTVDHSLNLLFQVDGELLKQSLEFSF
jgi:hypothetical protein